MLLLILSSLAAPPAFSTLEPGLELAIFTSPVTSGISDEKIHVVRADPKLWKVDVGLASEEGGAKRTAEQWMAENPSWVAVTNASMFATDHVSSVFQLRHGEHVNQSTWHKNASDVLVFDGGPSALLDINCDDWPGARKTYRSWVQNYRLIDCSQKPVWGDKNGRKWSHAVIGADSKGRILFIHARSPWTTRQFTEILLGLPLDLKRLMYAEGGPEASLMVRSGRTEIRRMGSYETGFVENDDNARFWGLPNVVALRPR